MSVVALATLGNHGFHVSDSGSVATAPLTVAEQTTSKVDHSIPLLNRVVRATGVDRATIDRGRSASEPIHAIVQLHKLPAAGDLDTLSDLGVVPLAYLNAPTASGTAYLASLAPTVADSDPRFAGLVRAVQPLLPEDKIDLGLASNSAAATDAFVLFFADVAAADADQILTKHRVVAARDGESSTYVAKLSPGQIRKLASEDAVQFLAAVPDAGQFDLDSSRALVNVDGLQQLDVNSGTYLGLSGLGVQLSIHDSGVDQHHNDFDGRMLNTLHPAQGGDHGTHVASIAAGSGVMSNQNDDNNNPNGGTAFQWRGMAPQAQIAAFGSQTANSAAVMNDAINNFGVDVSNHSYSYNDGQYDATMVNIDTIIRGDSPGIPPRPVVFSAGNQGLAPQFGNNSGYFSLSKSCKNCIMVANLQDNGALSGGSSHGPTPDGRLKPDLGANGRGVIAAGADVHDGNTPTPGPSVGNSYRNKAGTSMSTPAITGIIALLLQQYAEQFGVDIDTAPPLPSTLKAILLQTALDQIGTASGTNPDTGAATTYGAGPDWGTGYGSADAQAASDLLAAELFLEDQVATDDVTDEHQVSVVAGQPELRVTIAWDDRPGTPNANHAAPALVNDLDLLLIGPNGEVHRPLVMPAAAQFDCDANAANGTQTGCANPGADPGPWPGAAAEGTDRLNNVEQVVINAPAPGLWRARVSVLNTDSTVRLPLGGTQSYSIAGVTDNRADLGVQKFDSPDPVKAGEELFYTVVVTNEGPDDARDVVVVDDLPDEVIYLSDNGGCTYEAPPVHRLTCALGDIPAGESRSFQIKTLVKSDTVVNENDGTLNIENVVTVTSSTPDADTSDDSETEITFVQDKADLKVTKVCKPDDELPAGETGTCTIYVDNLGPSWARDVILRDTNLSDGEFTIGNITATQGSCDPPANGVVICELGDLAAASTTEPGRATVAIEVSATEDVDINDVADARSPTPDPDMSNNEARDHISVMAVADLSLTKTGETSAIAGNTITYNISIQNNGPSTAQGVVVEDDLSPGVEIVSMTGSNAAGCNVGTPGNPLLPSTCSFGTLAPGATRTMTIVVRVLPGTRGPIHNDARVTSQTFDGDLSNNLDTVATDVTGQADLSITKSDSPDPVVAGQLLTYTIVVANNGPSTAEDVVITDTLDPNTTYVSGVDGNGNNVCALVQQGVVVCQLGDIDPGDSKTVYLTVQVSPSTPPGTTLTNRATVSSSTPDPNQSNNSATATTGVNTSADVWLDKQAVPRSGNPSPVIVYTLVVHNNAGCETDAQSSPTPTCGSGGPSDARDIVVTDTLPLNPKKLKVQFLSPQCTYTQATHTVTCTSANVPAGAEVSFVIEVQVQGSVGTISNSASLTTSTPDPVPGNNTNAATLVMRGGTGKA